MALHLSAFHVFVFLDEAFGDGGVPLVLDGFDAVQSGAQAGVAGFALGFAQQVGGAAVAFMEAVQFGRAFR